MPHEPEQPRPTPGPAAGWPATARRPATGWTAAGWTAAGWTGSRSQASSSRTIRVRAASPASSSRAASPTRKKAKGSRRCLRKAPPHGGVFRFFARWPSARRLSLMLAAPWPPYALPLFHLYGDPPDERRFRLHPYRDHCLALIHPRLDDPRAPPPQSVSGAADRTGRRRDEFTRPRSCRFRLRPRSWCRRPPRTASVSSRRVTDGWVVSFTEDVADALGDRSGEAFARLKAWPPTLVPLADAAGKTPFGAVRRAARGSFARARRLSAGHARTFGADRIEVVRLAASRARTGSVTLRAGRRTRRELRRLIDGISARSG